MQLCCNERIEQATDLQFALPEFLDSRVTSITPSQQASARHTLSVNTNR
jgi:hypothetical protein